MVVPKPKGGGRAAGRESGDRRGAEWRPQPAVFRRPDNRGAAWQLINTLVPYGCLWYLMIRSIQLGYPYGLTLLLAPPAAAFPVRTFILFHDCVHMSFFSDRGNPRIPNYHLKKSYDAVPELRAKTPLTLRESLVCLRLKVWDEQRGKMAAFS